MEAWLGLFAAWPAWALALGGGAFITACNVLGAALVLVWPRPSPRFLDTSLGFAAGVMLTASFTSLILPGIEAGGLWPVLVGLFLGAWAMDVLDHRTPHAHPHLGREGPRRGAASGVWLFVVAIALHNAPEGMAVGVGFGAGDVRNAWTLMLAIGVQNAPEGLAVAVAALGAGMGGPGRAFSVGARAGLIELPMALLGALAVQAAAPLLPYAMGFAAGAMLYVISDEIVPETHRRGHERAATWGTLLGAAVMLALDVAFG